MRTVWKFTLELVDYQVVAMPDGARIIHCADQMGALCIWAEVDTDAPMVSRTVAVVGTGHRLVGGHHVGSVMQREGLLVWHIYIDREVTR